MNQNNCPHDFQCRLSIQIRMTDIDPLNHVNNGIFASYYDLGRLNYFQTLGSSFALSDIDLVLVHTEFDFMESVRFEDKIAVESKITHLGKKSVQMWQRIIDLTTMNVKSTCFSVLSGYDKVNNTSKEISAQFVELVKKFEKIE
ncbi:MAG: acyl-CoA thioesterase [Bacteroidales bacterium]|nr:acyl-CoA thioesterase [Bacteroidales bacterium]